MIKIEGVAFTRPDDGSWTIMVAEERAVVAEEHTAQSDLVMTHALEIFAKTAFKVHDRMEAMQICFVIKNL